MAHKKRAAPDWERIETDYRAGLLSLREIAASQGISHAAISKRAKRDGWERDLKAKIQAKADALVTRREVTKTVTTEQAVTDKLIVDANAQVIADIRIGHRTDIARSRRLAMSLLEELEGQTGDPDLLAQLGDLVLADAGINAARLRDIYDRVTSLGSRTSTMKALGDTLKTLIGLEREAYGLDANQSNEEQVPAGLSHFYGESETDA